MSLLERAKKELLRSNREKQHPFRFFYLATFGEFPDVRTIVTREVKSDLSLVFFTDSRSPKVAQIQSKPKVSALFYHPEEKLQVRIRGIAKNLDQASPSYRSYFDQAKMGPSLSDYRSALAPGTPITSRTQDALENEIYFSVLEIRPVELDILQLSDNKHQRARYKTWEGSWQGTRITP